MARQRISLTARTLTPRMCFTTPVYFHPTSSGEDHRSLIFTLHPALCNKSLLPTLFDYVKVYTGDSPFYHPVPHAPSSDYLSRNPGHGILAPQMKGTHLQTQPQELSSSTDTWRAPKAVNPPGKAIIDSAVGMKCPHHSSPGHLRPSFSRFIRETSMLSTVK